MALIYTVDITFIPLCEWRRQGIPCVSKKLNIYFLLWRRVATLRFSASPAARRRVWLRPGGQKATEKKQILVWLLGFNAKYKYFVFWWCSSRRSSIWFVGLPWFDLASLSSFVFFHCPPTPQLNESVLHSQTLPFLDWVHLASLVSLRVPFIICFFTPPMPQLNCGGVLVFWWYSGGMV